MNRCYTPVLLALACSAAGSALAQPESTGGVLEETIVISSRVPMPLRQVGTAVSVLDEQHIAMRSFNSLYDALRTQPAVSANNTGGAGGITSLQIRGEDGYRTLVLIDDIDISDTSGPQVSPRMEHILTAGIQRVEILRGPQGLMYGADAGGVINLSTLKADEGLQGYAQGEAGRYGTQQFSAGIGGKSESIDYALSATDYETDGFNSRDTDTVLRDDDGYDNTTVHGRLGWNVSEALRLQAVYRDVETEGEYDSCFTNAFVPSDLCSSEFEQQAWRLSAEYVAGRFKHELAYSGNDTDRQAYTEGEPTFGSEGERERWTYLGSFYGGDKLKFVYGVDLLTDQLDDGTFDRERDQDGYYLEYQGEVIDSLFITAGARYDDNEDFGSHTTWRSSAAYVMSLDGGDLKFRGAYGTGFRSPSLYEIAYNSGPFGFPPASETELDAEESEGLDVGLSWYGDNGLLLEAGYFDQEITDIIYFDLVNFSGYLQDRGDTTSEGIELNAEVPLPWNVLLAGNYTWNDTETVDGSVRPRRPEQLANVALQWSNAADTLLLALQLRITRGAEDTDGSDMDDYEVVNLSANWQLMPQLELFGRVENLFDEDYQEVPTYNTSGAAAYAGLRFTF